MQTSQSRAGALLIGALLIVFGAGAIVVRQSGISLSWPAWVILPGIVLFLAAFAVPVPGGSGLAAAGALVTIVGAILAFQDATGAYSSWSYAWALVAPGGVGLGLFLYGIVMRRGDIARGGFAAMGTGIVLFLVFFVFFEGGLRLNGGRFGDLSTVVVPGALVVLGVLVIGGAFTPGPWRERPGRTTGRDAWTAPGAAPGGVPATAPGQAPSWAQASAGVAPAVVAPSGAGVASASVAPAAVVDVSTGEGPAGPAAGAPGFTGMPGSGEPPASAWAEPAPADAVTSVDVPLGSASDAEVRIAFGAGRLLVGAAQPGRLADGTCRGGVDISSPMPGRLRLAARGPSWNWTRVPFEWRLGLTAEVPLRLEVETGASEAELDLSLLRVTDLRLRVGAAQARVVLPAAAGLTRVDAEGGAAQLRFRVPDGVAARIRTSMSLGSTDVDTTRFPAAADGRTWASPDFATAANRVEIEIRGGMGAASVS